MYHVKGLLTGLKHASDGFMWTAKSQLNMRIHLMAFIFVILLGLVLRINYFEWIIILLMSIMMLVLELLNTSLEQTSNAISLEYNSFIKRAKDISAAAVLVYAIGALIVGLIIFGSKL